MDGLVLLEQEKKDDDGDDDTQHLTKLQQVGKDLDQLLIQYQDSQKQVDQLNRLVRDKDEKLNKLQTLSQIACDFCEDIQNKYDADAEAINVVLDQGSKWYKENKELKRTSVYLLQRIQDADVDDDDNIALNLSTIYNNFESSIKDDENNFEDGLTELKNKLSQVTYERNRTKQTNEKLTSEYKALQAKYEEECFNHRQTKEKQEQLQQTLDRLQRVSVMAVEEFTQMQERLAEEQSTAIKAKSEVKKVQREKNALHRKSVILLGSLETDQQLHNALAEVEKIGLILDTTKEKLEIKVAEVDKLHKLVESLQHKLESMTQTCEQLEAKDKQNLNKILSLEKQVTKAKNRLENDDDTERKTAPAPPPPPPPPPPQQWSWNPLSALISVIGLSRSKKPDDVVPSVPKNPRKEAMDEVMQKIRKGEFQLRPVNSRLDKEATPQETVSTTAVNEMMTILSSMKKDQSVQDHWPGYVGSLNRKTPTKYTRIDMRRRTSMELENVLQKRRQILENEDIKQIKPEENE